MYNRFIINLSRGESLMLELRKVVDGDRELLFKWRNDVETRRQSFNNSNITYLEHKNWFSKKMISENCDFFIVIKEGMSVGQVRIELEEKIGIINYSIDRKQRGQGLGTEVLELLKQKYIGNVLVGKVKRNNIASIRAFKKAGYIEYDREDIIEFRSKQDF